MRNERKQSIYNIKKQEEREIFGIYKGANGSMGFKYNKTYRFKTLVDNGLLLLKTSEGLICYYSNMEKILDNWEIITNDAVFKDEEHHAIYWGDFLKDIEGNDTHHQDNWDDF